MKARLIVDMFRSGVNGRIRMRERIVLPRDSDLAESALDLLEAWQGILTAGTTGRDSFESEGEGLEFAASDFADAF